MAEHRSALVHHPPVTPTPWTLPRLIDVRERREKPSATQLLGSVEGRSQGLDLLLGPGPLSSVARVMSPNSIVEFSNTSMVVPGQDDGVMVATSRKDVHSYAISPPMGSLLCQGW